MRRCNVRNCLHLVLLAIPVLVFLGTGVLAGVLGFFLKKDVDQQYEGSELLQLS